MYESRYTIEIQKLPKNLMKNDVKLAKSGNSWTHFGLKSSPRIRVHLNSDAWVLDSDLDAFNYYLSNGN